MRTLSRSRRRRPLPVVALAAGALLAGGLTLAPPTASAAATPLPTAVYSKTSD